MNTEKQRAFIIHFLYFSIIISLIYILFRYVIYYIMPFLIGFGIAFLLRPIIKRLTNLTHGYEKLWSTLVILLFYATIGTFFTLLALKGFSFLQTFVSDIPRLYQQQIEPFLNDSLSNVESVWKGLDITTAQAIQSFMDGLQNSISTMVTSFSKGVVSMFTDFAKSLPNVVVSFFFAIISSFFFNADYQKIIVFLTSQLSHRGQHIVFTIRHYFTETIGKFIIAYAKIMSLTFIELSIGFHIIGVENAFVIAFLIAIFDVLPVLGTGGIMIPWILISFLNSHIKLGVGLIIVYLVVTIIRNILEPRIVGKQIGLHPLLMLLCMYLGARLFGILGIFILPIMILILQNLNDTGILKLYHK